jgi:hypothetical protein
LDAECPGTDRASLDLSPREHGLLNSSVTSRERIKFGLAAATVRGIMPDDGLSLSLMRRNLAVASNTDG